METTQLKYLNAFNCIPGIGPATLHKILNYFKGNFKSAWETDIEQFRKAGVNKEQIEAIKENKVKVNPEKEFEKIERENLKILTIKDKEYPKQLKEISSPPIILYIKGKLNSDDSYFAVVGTRIPSDYGKIAAQEITNQLSLAGFTIVSGLAKGIDSIAHRSALENNKRTIAVIGSGLDKNSLYPSENWMLSEEIKEKRGVIISEFPVGVKATREKFPQRNRIISGLSKGVLIVEAAQRSGALITANFALEQNREVFAIPGNIYSKVSYGTNKLIQQGAKLVLSPEDILSELNAEYVYNNKEIIADNETEEKILEILSKEPVFIDEIIRKSELSVQTVNATLIEMEMKRKIKNLDNDKYILAN